MDISLFKLFDPQKDDLKSVPCSSGNYIVVLRKNCQIPKVGIPPEIIITYCKFKGYKVIYTGLAGSSLRDRDVKKHIRGTAGSSTLRKSLGALFGYLPIPRDSNFDKNRKTKYGDTEEKQLSDWIVTNLLFFYYPNNDCETLENLLIKEFNPPLNLSKNDNPINQKFRAQLTALRNRKPQNQSYTNSLTKSDLCKRHTKGRRELYVEIWQTYLPSIIDKIRDKGGVIYVAKNLFEIAGNRKNSGYSFNLKSDEHHISHNRSSAVARDLQKVLEATSDFKTVSKGKNIVIRLNKRFELHIHVYPKNDNYSATKPQ